jgi:hypothetical protein
MNPQEDLAKFREVESLGILFYVGEPLKPIS